MTPDEQATIAKALRGEISHGKLAEILGIEDVHAFKLASGAFETPADEQAVEAAKSALNKVLTVLRDVDCDTDIRITMCQDIASEALAALLVERRPPARDVACQSRAPDEGAK